MFLVMKRLIKHEYCRCKVGICVREGKEMSVEVMGGGGGKVFDVKETAF